MKYFDYTSSTENLDVESFLEETQKIESELIQAELERIEEQLERRETLHEETLDELVSKQEWYIERLELLYKRSVGKSTGDHEHLKNRIEEFYERIRNAKRSNWIDRQELEREKRGLLKDLGELEDESLFNLF